MYDHEIVTIEPKGTSDFVETPFLQSIMSRALHYLRSGFAIHFRGNSGTGKTTLALRVAELLGKPVTLIHGDEELRTSDLIGAENGYYYRRSRDNFIASVLKEEEEGYKQWSNNRLTIAIENGHTLIYDEFTRSRPEANNVLLSVLQEGILDIPQNHNGR